MTARVEAERAIADVLAGHDHYEWVHIIRRFECRGCHEPMGDSYPDDAHRAHVASVLADLMAERQAEALTDAAGAILAGRQSWGDGPGGYYGFMVDHVPLDAWLHNRAATYRPDPKDTRDE